MNVFFVNVLLLSTLKYQIRQQHHLKKLYSMFQDSSLFPPSDDKKVPTANNIEDTIKETIENSHENSFFTKGCIIANIIIAVPIFNTVFPSSFKPLSQFIINYYKGV